MEFPGGGHDFSHSDVLLASFLLPEEDGSLHILFSRNAQPPARLLEQGLPLEGELLQSEDNVLGLTGRPRIGLVPSGG